MSQYTKSTNFATKDNLSPGNPLKIVKGTEIDTEFNNIQTAVATKTDNASAAITGGSITGITDLAVADGGTGASTAAGGLNNLLPTQTGNANKYLQTDGTNATWDAVSLSTSDITGTLPVANGGTGVTSSTGTGAVVLSNSPTLVTPALGTPASGTATNLTGLPISTGVSGLGTGVATFLGTPSSANLASAVTDETGSGALVFANSPTLITPALGTPSALVGTNITGTASGLTAGNVTTNANLTGAVTSVGNATSLGSFSSSNLAGALTDETGSGSAVFATSPTLVTPILGTPTSATLTNATGLPISTGVSGLGTGVATALAVNVGSSGAPLVNGGVLGTPSSGTATNLTGLPLSTGVTGTLPVANGGTGTATPSIVAGTNVTVTGTWPNQTIASTAGGSGTVTSVDVSGGTTGLTTSGGPVTSSGTVTLAGTLAVANGGTGQTSYTDGQLLIGNTTGNTLTKTTLTAGSGITITNGSGAITIASSGGSGDVVGPASSTDNAIARFDSTTGKIIQNSVGILSDAGALSGLTTISASGAITSTQTAAADVITATSATANGKVIRMSTTSGGLMVGVEVGSGSNYIIGSTYDDAIVRGRTGGISFSVNDGSSVAMRLASTGLAMANNVGVGGATPSSSGAGITFPASQSASSNANTLDDYEEGTWTPNSGGTATYSSQNGTYTKVGNKVTVHFSFQVNVIGTGSASTILGLPFTASASAGSQSGHMSYATGLTSNQIFIGGYVSASGTTFTTTSSGAAASSVTTNNIIGNGTLLIGDITYFV